MSDTTRSRKLKAESGDDSDEDGITSPSSTEDDPYDDISPALRDVTPQIRSLSDVAKLIFSEKAKNVIIMAGAGISTSAGIPDFRSPETGLYANLEKLNLPRPEAVFELDYFRRRPEPFFTLAKDLYPGKYLPTPTHYFLRLLHTHSQLLRLYTQNIDTLETTAGVPSSQVVEAHGSFAQSHCLDCGIEVDGEWMRERVREGGVVRCGEKGREGKGKEERVCGGLIKPDIVFFGEGLPKRFYDLVKTDFPKCDLLLVLGTSLQVHPFASLIDRVPSTCPRVLINHERVGTARGPWDSGFLFGTKGNFRDLFFEGDADNGARELAKALGWEEELDGLLSGHREELKVKWELEMEKSVPANKRTVSSKEQGEPDRDSAPTFRISRLDTKVLSPPSREAAHFDLPGLGNISESSNRVLQRLSTSEEYESLLNKFDTFLFDCDGVLWRGPNLVPGAKEVLSLLRSRGKKIVFVTNNAKKSRGMLKKAFDDFGIDASEEEIIGSAYATAVYLSEILKFPKDGSKRVYILGEEGLERELESVGIPYCGGTDPEDRVFMPSGDFSAVKPDPSIGAVVCGFDAYVNLKKYAKAHTYITTNPGCHFILTNSDPTFPSAGAFYPGSGAMSAPLRYSTKVEPTVVGKPNSHMMDSIVAAHKFDPSRTIMVGDNLETDILFGINSNITTLLVMTGVTKESDLSGPEKSSTVPDYVMDSIANLQVLGK